MGEVTFNNCREVRRYLGPEVGKECRQLVREHKNDPEFLERMFADYTRLYNGDQTGIGSQFVFTTPPVNTMSKEMGLGGSLSGFEDLQESLESMRYIRFDSERIRAIKHHFSWEALKARTFEEERETWTPTPYPLLAYQRTMFVALHEKDGWAKVETNARGQFGPYGAIEIYEYRQPGPKEGEELVFNLHHWVADDWWEAPMVTHVAADGSRVSLRDDDMMGYANAGDYFISPDDQISQLTISMPYIFLPADMGGEPTSLLLIRQDYNHMLSGALQDVLGKFGLYDPEATDTITFETPAKITGDVDALTDGSY